MRQMDGVAAPEYINASPIDFDGLRSHCAQYDLSCTPPAPSTLLHSIRMRPVVVTDSPWYM